jgi:hypothetical protein
MTKSAIAISRLFNVKQSEKGDRAKSLTIISISIMSLGTMNKDHTQLVINRVNNSILITQTNGVEASKIPD